MRQSNGSLKVRRSFTKNHDLLPARQRLEAPKVPHIPSYSLIGWTFSRGSVIWRIWPAVLLHTAFAALTVTLSMKQIVELAIPSVMLTVLGVVIGFVISYRAMSGYDRYWLGRTCWSDVIRNARTLGRLIWFHVPPLLLPKTSEESTLAKTKRSREELSKVMDEKRAALDLVEGFAVALKHHIRGELGIYYEDLYHLVRPLHKHGRTIESLGAHDDEDEEMTPKPTMSSAPASPSHRQPRILRAASELPAHAGPSSSLILKANIDPVIPPINVYGTFSRPNTKLTASSRYYDNHHHLKHTKSQSSLLSQSSRESSNGFDSSHDVLLLPSTLPSDDTYMAKVSSELIPFSGLANIIGRYIHSRRRTAQMSPSSLEEAADQTDGQTSEHGQPEFHRDADRKPHKPRWRGPIWTGSSYVRRLPKIAGGGENLPLEVLRCLSEWLSVLENRGTVPGTTMGAMIGTIAAFEENLSALERTLTTPLPFVYSVHIRHTVWLYLFFLPFQLIDQFGYYTIPGVATAAFIYLGFLAAGEEIEQPFGYDDNDLDLDLFCQEIVRPEIEHLKNSHGLNVYLGPSELIPRKPGPPRRRSTTALEIPPQSKHKASDLAHDA